MAFKREILTRVFELQEELLLFFKDHNKVSFSNFLGYKMAMKRTYLVDIYQHLKHLEHQHVGPKRKYFNFHKVLASKNKLQVWKNTLQVEIMQCFCSYFRFWARQIIISYLELPAENLSFFVIRNIWLLLSSHQIHKIYSLQEEEHQQQLIELQCDQTMMITFNESSPVMFWISIRK